MRQKEEDEKEEEEGNASKRIVHVRSAAGAKQLQNGLEEGDLLLGATAWALATAWSWITRLEKGCPGVPPGGAAVGSATLPRPTP